jgi:hypothetical protein
MQRASTHADEQGGDSSRDGQRKEQRDELGWALGVGAEDVVDLGLLAVSERLLVHGGKCVLVELDLDVKYVLLVALSLAERGQNQRSLEGLGRGQELDGDVGVFLQARGQLAILANQGRD